MKLLKGSTNNLTKPSGYEGSTERKTIKVVVYIYVSVFYAILFIMLTIYW